MGFGDRWAKGDLTDKEKQLMKAEMDRRTAVYTQAHPSKAVPYTPPPAEDIELATAAEEDIKAAQNVSYEMRKRNADELGKLGIEREQALSEAVGPMHRQAIIEDFADRERALKEKLAEEERERQEKIAKRVEDLLQQGIAIPYVLTSSDWRLSKLRPKLMRRPKLLNSGLPGRLKKLNCRKQ